MADQLARDTKAVYKAALERDDAFVRLIRDRRPLNPVEASELSLALGRALLEALLFVARHVPE